MTSHLVSGLIFTCFAALGAFGGCVANTDPQAGDEVGVAQTEINIDRGAWYTLHRCMAPYCWGYYLKEVNGPTMISHVAAVDFTRLDDSVIDDVLSAPQGDAIVRGAFVVPGPREGVPKFIVTAAYRGMPGIAPMEGDDTYRTVDRNPPIVCFVAPCNNVLAQLVNGKAERPFTRMDLHGALAPLADGAWVDNMIREHGALVKGHFREGDQLPGGREVVLDVSQVYLKLPVERPMCMMIPHPVCAEGLRATFTRDENRCLAFDTCADMGSLLFFRPPACEDGYVRQGWATEAFPGFHYACDPAFAR